MKIAVVAPFEESVPPQKYGGTEVVVVNLVTELHRRGHDVTLFATGDSKVPCRLIPIFPTGIRTTEPFSSNEKTRERAKYVGIAKVLTTLTREHFDIVHNHIGWRFNPFSDLFKAPVVTTLHGPVGEIHERMVHDIFPNQRFISISNNQRKGFPELNYSGTVYNGIDLSLYPFCEKPEDEYLLFLARFSPQKGAKEAIEIAKKTGKKLKMAVKVDTVDREFFDSCKPLLAEAQVEIVGEVGMEEKIRLLQNAVGLLAPIQWEEPFGLFVVEAMACGTPVIGSRRGSFPELITHGVDGFLGDSTDELAGYVSKLGDIKRQDCRRAVEKRFTKELMAEGYLTLYEKIVVSEGSGVLTS